MDVEARASQGLDVSAESAAWDRFVESFLEGSFEAHPPFAVSAGRHDFDGRLPDWSREGIERDAARLRDARERADAFDPSCLDERRAFERDFVISQAESDLFWLEGSESPWRNPIFYAGSLDPSLYLNRRYAPLDDRLRAFVSFARAVPLAAAQVRENLAAPLPRTFAELGATTFSGLGSFLETDVPGVFAGVEDAGLQAAFGAANADAAKAFRELGAWFQDRVASAPTDRGSFALGPERYARMLRDTERVDLPLERVREAGWRELARNRAALAEACERLAPGLTPAEAVARVQTEKPAEGPVAAARRQLAGLRRFLDETGLVSIPGEEQALVAEAPPYQRWNAAYIEIPGPYDRHLPSVYYIAPPDPAWSPEERAAYLPAEEDLLFITIHEVWPGHFLQFLHSNRAASKLGQVFVGYGFAEGWAHYAEELMWEAGFGGGDPRVRIGQIQNALLRNVRYLVSLGLHTGEMTVAEAERMFREEAFQDPANARQQAARGTFDPGYLNYTLGKLMVRKLREDWTAPRGGRDAWRDFHDRFLSYGGPPIPLVRRAMLGEAGDPLPI